VLLGEGIAFERGRQRGVHL